MKKFSTFLKVICTFLIAVQMYVMVSPAAMAQEDVPAVIKVGPTAICTADINPCNNPSICTCPDGYEYNPSIKVCSIENIGDATSRGLESRAIESSWSIQALLLPLPCLALPPNQLGYPVSCACPEGTEYDQRIAHCTIPLRW